MRRFLILALTLAISYQLSASSVLFAKEVDDDLPMGSAGGSVRVDTFTGAATTSIPINVFPGRNGVQPNLQLTYASSNGNGWVGMGWKLELGAIERNTRFGVKYNETAADNGKVYAIRMSGMSAELIKLQPGVPSDPEYRAKVESGFFRIRTLATGGWEVTDRKGVKYSFGISANGRVEDTSTTPVRIFRWNLERVEDRDGNYMLVNYTKDQGQSYLDQIEYGLTTKDPVLAAPYSVKFYSAIPAGMTAPDTYNAYFQVTTAKRLQAIEVKAGGNRMRVYKLSYAPSPTTGIHRLESVQQFDRNAVIDTVTNNVTGNALPAVTMTYTTSASTFTASPTNSLGSWCSGASDVDPADFNGDGLQDLWCRNSAGGFTTALAVYNQGTTFTNVQTVFSGCGKNFVADFNGDGRQDLACVMTQVTPVQPNPPQPPVFWVYNVRSLIAYANSDGSFGAPSQEWRICQWGLPTPAPFEVGVGDFNGDGMADLWCHHQSSSSYITVGIFSLGTSFSHQSGTDAPTWLSWCSDGGIATGEFNGDGKADLICQSTGGTTSLRYSSSIGTTASFTTPSPAAPLSGWCPLSGSLKGKFNLADLNGDGLHDLWCHKTDGNVLVALATGTSFIAPSSWRTGFCVGGTAGVGDFNSDGVTDLWCRETSGTIQVSVSTETTLNPPTPWITAFCTVSLFGLADFNGDLKPDLWCVNNGTVSVAITDNPGVKIDLLSSMSNGLGASTALIYTPSTLLGVPHTLLPYPVYVVTSLSQSVTTLVGEAIGSQTTQTQYQYEKGYHSIPDRDFRGFQKATVTACATCSASEKTVTVTEFHQGSGTSPAEDVGADLAHPDAPTKGLPYRIVVQDSGLVPQLETLTTYATDIDTLAPWYTPSSQVVTRTYANGVIAKTTQVNFAHDHMYGNVIREDHQGDMGVIGDEKTIDRMFANELTNWLIGFPTRETIYKGISTAAQDKMAEATFYYDGTTTCATASLLQIPTIGHLTRTVNWLNGGVNPETRMAYDMYGNRICTRDPRGNQTTYAYDNVTHTYLKTVTNALLHVATTQYAGIDGQLLTNGLYGEMLSETDPNNQTTTSTYDTFGRPLSTTTPDLPNALVTTRTYPALAEFGFVGTQKVTTTVSGGGLTSDLVSQRYFDGLGRTIISETPGAGINVIRVQHSYDARGNVAAQTVPFFVGQTVGPVTTTLYDVLGRVSHITHPDQTITKFCYSGWDVDTLDAKGHRKREMKDAFGRVIKVEQFSGTGPSCAGLPTTVASSVTYTYDVLGNLLTSKDILNNTSTMTYDSLGRKLTMQDPDMGNWSYTYDANGNLDTQVDAKNQKLCFTYDAVNRRTQKNYGATAPACGTNTVVYAYDDTVAANHGKGRLRQVTDPAQTVTFQYDSRGRVRQSAKTIDSTTYTTTSVYDGLGRLTSVSYPTNPVKTVTYSYDGLYLKQVLEGATVYMTYGGWNALGQPATATSGNSVVSAYTYKPDTFQVSSVSTTSGTTPTAPTNLMAVPASQSQITLNWMPAGDDVGIASYQIERCQGAGCVTFLQVGTATTTTFNDMGLSAVTTYRYQVRAIDVTNNAGPYSIIASATTLVAPPTVGYGVLAYGLSGFGQ